MKKKQSMKNVAEAMFNVAKKSCNVHLMMKMFEQFEEAMLDEALDADGNDAVLNSDDDFDFEIIDALSMELDALNDEYNIFEITQGEG